MSVALKPRRRAISLAAAARLIVAAECREFYDVTNSRRLGRLGKISFTNTCLRAKRQREHAFYSVDGAWQRIGSVKIAFDDLDPAIQLDLRGIARQRAHFLPRRQELRSYFTSHCSCRSRNQNH